MKLGKDKGFTLVETLVALGLFSVLMAGVEFSILSNLRHNLDAQIRYEAIQAAQSVLDEIRFEDISELSGSRTVSLPIGRRTYLVSVTYCRISDFCPSDEIRHISLQVSYRSQQVYATDTVYTEF